MEQNHFSKTGRGFSKEHSGEIILKLAQRSGTILAILVEGHPKNISTKLC